LFLELQLPYLDEEKRTNQPTETTRSLSDLRCRHRRALSDVFRSGSAQRATCGAEISGGPSRRTRWNGHSSRNSHGRTEYLTWSFRQSNLTCSFRLNPRQQAFEGQLWHWLPGLAPFRTNVISKLFFPLALVETHRFRCGSTLDDPCLWKSATAPVTPVPMKRINQQ